MRIIVAQYYKCFIALFFFPRVGFDEAMLESSLSASQESLYGDDSSGIDVDHSPSESKNYDDYPKSIGLGKGKPFCSSNMAKKRFMSRPKGQQPGGKINYQKMKKMAEFGKKRVNKTKMRGVFGVPGLGLQVRKKTIFVCGFGWTNFHAKFFFPKFFRDHKRILRTKMMKNPVWKIEWFYVLLRINSY